MKTYTVYLTKDIVINVAANGFEKNEDTIYFYQEKDSEQKVIALFNFKNIYGFVSNEVELKSS